MFPRKNDFTYKISLSIIFGLFGFFFNFHTIIFPFGDYTVAILIGLLFPLLIALSWGWKYGLLSALAGGCQTMWWLWGPSNGYAVFLITPPFTLWVIWHGFFAELRGKQKTPKWWMNMYVVEIPFRILCTINLLTLSRWAIFSNPPPWDWASNAATMIPMHFSIFVSVKQASVAFVMLLSADVLMNISYVRTFLKLKKPIDHRQTGYIISLFLLLGGLVWALDSLSHAFAINKEISFVDLFALNIPDHNIFTGVLFFSFCLGSGLITAKILRKQREGEVALRESEEELFQIIQGSFIATFVINKEHIVTHWNKAAENLTGITQEEIIGTKGHWKPFCSEKRLTLPDYIADGANEHEIKRNCGERISPSLLIDGAYQGEDFFPTIGDKGKWIFFTAAPLTNKIGTLTGAIVTFLDITHRRQTEENATRSEALLRTLIRSIPDLVWLKNEQGNYLFCNSRFESLFGAKESEIVGKNDYDFVDKELADSFRLHDKIAMEAGKPCKNEEEVIFVEDGHHEILETIKVPICTNDGQLTGVLGIGRNITERVTLQSQLIQAQKMESVGRLAGGVAHDFNNMLSIIIGNTELLLDDLDTSDPAIPFLDEIYKAADNSSHLTRQLLAFARKQTIAPKILDLNQTLEGMLKMIRRLIGEDIDLKWQPGEDLPAVKIDPSQVDQILANLCVNARDAIQDVGTVTIETGYVSFDEEYCQHLAGFKPGNYVFLGVSDNGCGMSKETMKKLFEPFFTTKELGKGTGLGLATVYGIVKQNTGFINVYSEIGEGTIFRIYLPRHDGAADQQNLDKSKTTSLRGHETILLVEDERAILKLAEKMLKRLGYKVLTASSPAKALRLGTECDTDEIHLLMTDVIMPNMNGRDLAEKLLKKHPHIKSLFMSGYTANVIAHHGVLNEGVNFINKPFSNKDLSATLRSILDDVPKE